MGSDRRLDEEKSLINDVLGSWAISVMLRRNAVKAFTSLRSRLSKSSSETSALDRLHREYSSALHQSSFSGHQDKYQEQGFYQDKTLSLNQFRGFSTPEESGTVQPEPFAADAEGLQTFQGEQD